MLNQRNHSAQGNVGLAVAFFYFTIKGYNCSIPSIDNQHYDLIVDHEDCGIKTVQIKTTKFIHSQQGSYMVSLRHNTNKKVNGKRIEVEKKFDPNKVDILFVVLGNNDVYSIPTSYFEGKPRTTLSFGRVTTKKLRQYCVGNIQWKESGAA